MRVNQLLFGFIIGLCFTLAPLAASNAAAPQRACSLPVTITEPGTARENQRTCNDICGGRGGMTPLPHNWKSPCKDEYSCQAMLIDTKCQCCTLLESEGTTAED